MSRLKLLDCTLRDGAYIVNADFGEPAIKGIIRKLQDAHIDIIECGWLKDKEHEKGHTFYHVPSDVVQYITERKSRLGDRRPVGNIFLYLSELHVLR